MDSLSAARALAEPVGYLGGRWMTDRATYEKGSEAGVAGFAFYFLGRGAALGDVSGEVVASAMTFFPLTVVEPMWNEGRAVLAPQAALEVFTGCCWSWGRARFGGSVGEGELRRTAELVGRVVDTAEASMLTLFAGWRAAARPDDPPALAAQLLHVLRELRGGAHGIAVRATGLSPVEAAVALYNGQATGFGSPQAMGWPEPLPECTDELLERRRQAEELTDRIMAPAFDVLEADERTELIDRVEALRAALKTG